MTEYFRGALFYFLCFLTGCAFAALVFGWSLHSHRIEQRQPGAGEENAERILRRAFSFGLRQLVFFLVLGACSFSLVGGVLWWRAQSEGKTTGSASTPAQPMLSPHSPASTTSTQNVSASRLAGIPLFEGAQAVTDAGIIGSSSQQLQRLVSEVDPQAQLSDVEIVMWRGVAGEKARQTIAATTKALQSAKWLYRETNADSQQGPASNGVHEFIAANTKQKRILTGFWLVSEQFLLLSWGEVKAHEAA